MFRNSRHLLGLAALVAVVGRAQEDLTLPPRILDSARPGQARLADAPAQTAAETLEEIVVTGDDNPWRLPDLGSEWRAREAERQEQGRISADLFPLWDPEAQQPPRDLFVVNSEFQRVGFIEVFRVRFGRR